MFFGFFLSVKAIKSYIIGIGYSILFHLNYGFSSTTTNSYNQYLAHNNLFNVVLFLLFPIYQDFFLSKTYSLIHLSLR